MSFVEVVGHNGEAECLQQAGATNSQDHFLFKTIGLIATIELVRDLPIILTVLVEVSVEKEDRCTLA